MVASLHSNFILQDYMAVWLANLLFVLGRIFHLQVRAFSFELLEVTGKVNKLE